MEGQGAACAHYLLSNLDSTILSPATAHTSYAAEGHPMIGQSVSHYQITDRLGQGGMGVVYKARDLKLKRTVALKFLPPELTRDEQAKVRFMHEAQAASALDHVNVGYIHEIDETEDGRLFIAMAYYAGETLKQKIKRGPLPLDEALNYATQVAQGLAKAHGEGIVHRDVKPANVMVTEDGVVKIVDFGLAKVAEQTQLTKTGSTLGTVAYMSPEQARGGAVDARTDLWSLGVVLYEMLTGARPFRGEYEQAVIYSVLNEEPTPLGLLQPEVPETVAQVVERLLQKNPAARYQTASEVVEALRTQDDDSVVRSNQGDRTGRRRWVAVAAVALIGLLVVGSYTLFGREKATGALNEVAILAVLPFSNLQSNPKTNFLGYALADQVISSLTYVQNLTVRPSSSVRKYQHGDYDLDEVRDELSVNFVLAGNYLQQGDLMRLTVELIDLESEQVLWSEPIEVSYQDAFAMQDLVSEWLLARLKISFSQDERARMQSDVSHNPLAYEYYLRSLSKPSTSEGDLLAIEMVNKSIQLDSSYAPAFAELGFRRQRYGNFGLAGAQEISKAEQAYLRALSLNDELLDALFNLSSLYTEMGRTEKAVELARRMLTINPNSAQAHYNLGYVYRYAGMLEESEKEFDRALEIDPGNRRFRTAGLTYVSLGKYEKAVEVFNLDKGSSLALAWTARVFHLQGQEQKAIETWTMLQEQEPRGSTFSYYSTVRLALVEGETEKARTALVEFEQANPADAEVWFLLAEMYGLLDDAVSTARALEEGVNRGYFNYPWMVSYSYFDGVRSSAEFQRVLEMAKVRHETFKEKFF